MNTNIDSPYTTANQDREALQVIAYIDTLNASRELSDRLLIEKARNFEARAARAVGHNPAIVARLNAVRRVMRERGL